MKRGWTYIVKKISNLETIEFEGMQLHFLIQKKETDGMAAYHIKLPRHTRIPPSYHKIAEEIIVVLQGSGFAFLNRKRIPIKKGSVILVQPRTWHSFASAHKQMTLLAVTSPYVDSKTDLYHH